MTFSPFDEAIAIFDSAAGMLESLGRTRGERVEDIAAMLRNSSPAGVEELGTVFALALAKLAEEQSTG